MLLDFNAIWCFPCRVMDREVWPKQKVVEQAERFVCVSVDVDIDRWHAQQYLVEEIPRIVVTDPFGNELSRRTGSKSAIEIAQWLMSFPERFKRLQALKSSAVALPGRAARQIKRERRANEVQGA